MPAGGEGDARAFYSGVLGIPEAEKPSNLAKRGGCWFERGVLKVHLGVEPNFRPASKAHPAFIVENLAALSAKLAEAGYPVITDEPLKGYSWQRKIVGKDQPPRWFAKATAKLIKAKGSKPTKTTPLHHL